MDLDRLRAIAKSHEHTLCIKRINDHIRTEEATISMVGYYLQENDENRYLAACRSLLDIEENRFQFILFSIHSPQCYLKSLMLLAEDLKKNVMVVSSKVNIGYVEAFIWSLALSNTPYYVTLQDDCYIKKPFVSDILEQFKSNIRLSTIAPLHPKKGGFIDSWCIAHPRAMIEKALSRIEAEYCSIYGGSLVQTALEGNYPNKAKYSAIQLPIMNEYGKESVLPCNIINDRICHAFLRRYYPNFHFDKA